MLTERQEKILTALKEDPTLSVRALARMLYVSEPTVRRDFTALSEKGFLTKHYGGASVTPAAADTEIPFLLRAEEKSDAKTEIARRAAALVEDGMVIMLDGSTSAFRLVPFLKDKKDIICITSGARTSVALAEAGIKNFSTGGQMVVNSFSFVGAEAEHFVSTVSADILFFSCRGLTDMGEMTDRATGEAALRRKMFERCRRLVLLCDSTKLGQTCFYSMGDVADIDDVITEGALPESIASRVGKRRTPCF